MSITDTRVANLPYLTPDLPGAGGVIKRYDEDFIVEELPLYLPSGQGTHVYFQIEKRGLPTLAAIQHLARALGRQPRDIGYAGLKDAHGVTRQMLSLEHIDPARVSSVSLSRIKVLSVDRHTNKLKLGHLAGNRFVVGIRETAEDALPAAKQVFDILIRRGVPNYFGPQRFGARGDNAAIGLALLNDDYSEALALVLGRPGPADHGEARRARERFDAGDYSAAAEAWPRGVFAQQSRICRAMAKAGGDARKAWRAVDHTLRKFYLSAFQSALFNQVLAERIAAIDHLHTGDVAYKHANGACFHVEDAALEQPRCEAFEISPTGPLFGKRMTDTRGEPGQLEAGVLARSGITREQLVARDGGKLDGARRPLRVPLTNATIDARTDDRGPVLQISFSLPAGAYATNVAREICKSTD
ncbi:MAG: tRNA pseudouridine(13) synthase TruD [Planctomycetota bacterium]